MKGRTTEGNRFAFMKIYRVENLLNPEQDHFVRLRVIDTPWFGVYVHKLITEDPGDPHDHPFNFISVILRGGYVEARFKDQYDWIQTRRAYGEGFPRINYMTTENLHRITSVAYGRPCWTLVFRGRRVKQWGFRVGNRMIAAPDYAPRKESLFRGQRQAR